MTATNGLESRDRPFGTPPQLLAAGVITLTGLFVIARLPGMTVGNKLPLWTLSGFLALWWYHVTVGAWLSRGKQLWRAVLIVFGVALLGLIVQWLAVTPLPTVAEPHGQPLKGIGVPLLVIDYLWIPVFEDVGIRGFVYQAVRIRRNAPIAIIVCTLLDFVLHLAYHTPAYALSIVPGSLVSAILRWWSGGIVISMIMHVIHNLLIGWAVGVAA